ncbi:MAG: response regulator [Elusimicrobia bacterium]|nr:response regulator [Elusimicrobiota bacterium]
MARKQVLVIDDDPETSALVTAILSQTYEVDSAADGLQGIKLARQRMPNLIVCDIMMPRMGGKELLDAMSRDHALMGVPVITMSGWDLDTSTKGVLQSYSNYRGHLRKPLNIDEIVSRARQALGDGGDAGPAAPLAPIPTASPASQKQKNILIAEDDAAVRKFLTASIGPAHQIAEAADGREAWGKLKAQPPDLLFLDLVMPGATGFELLREMAAHPETRGVPVVIVSALRIGPAESAVLFKDFPGIKKVLQKPLDAAAVRAAADAILK